VTSRMSAACQGPVLARAYPKPAAKIINPTPTASSLDG
jgi:hypothetical protein